MTSIFEGQPSKTRPFSSKTRVIWVLGKYIPWKSPFLKMVVPKLDDDKPLLKKWWFGSQPIKNGGQGLPWYLYMYIDAYSPLNSKE